MAVTNGRMMVTTSSSLDTPDVSSNDEDDASNASNYSSHSSVHSAHAHDDPASAIVDDTGHLRPVTEDDVFLEMESDSEDDDEKDDDNDDINNEPEERGAQSQPSPATIPKEMIKQRQNAARPPAVRTKPARPSRKIQPTEIPRITVVDFGEEGIVDGEGEEADSSEVHVDPLVIVENENTEGRAHRPKKFGTKKNRKARHTAPSVTNEEGSERDQIHTHSGPGERTKGSSGESASGPVNRPVLKSGAKLTGTDEAGSGTQSTHGRASKNKFSSILARFQRLDGEG